MLGDDTDTPAGQTLLTTNSSIAYIAAAHSSGGTKILINNRREPGKGTDRLYRASTGNDKVLSVNIYGEFNGGTH